MELAELVGRVFVCVLGCEVNRGVNNFGYVWICFTGACVYVYKFMIDLACSAGP